MNANITLLGTSNSGKTNFISEAIKDINSFSPKITITSALPTENNNMQSACNNQYILKAYEDIQWEFSICDYEGNLLNIREDESTNLKRNLYSSDTWIVLVDGAYFDAGDESDEKVIRKIKRCSARVLLPCISDYAEEHGEKMPTMLFVVTKADRFMRKFSSDQIKHIITVSFEGIFTEKYSHMILLSETSNTKSAGLAVLLLFYVKYAKEISNGIAQLENRNRQIMDDIDGLRNQIFQIENQKILGKFPANKRKIEGKYNQISSLNIQLAENNTRIEQFRADMGLTHLGICVQCLINNNRKLLVCGFEDIIYQHKKFPAEMEGNSHGVKAVLIFSLVILGIFILYLIANGGFIAVFAQAIIVFIFIALTYKMANTKAKVILGVCSALAFLKLGGLSGSGGRLFAFGYVVWLTISILIAAMWGKKYSGLTYQNKLVKFFNTRAKGKK